MVTLEEGQDTRTFDSLFYIVLWKNVYKLIMRRPFAEALDTVVSLVHLKQKYYNVYDKLVTISVELYGAKRIYKVLQEV